jgi:hypothetical protein
MSRTQPRRVPAAAEMIDSHDVLETQVSLVIFSLCRPGSRHPPFSRRSRRCQHQHRREHPAAYDQTSRFIASSVWSLDAQVRPATHGRGKALAKITCREAADEHRARFDSTPRCNGRTLTQCLMRISPMVFRLARCAGTAVRSAAPTGASRPSFPGGRALNIGLFVVPSAGLFMRPKCRRNRSGPRP